MKKMLLIVLLLGFSLSFSQENRTIDFNKDKNLYEVVYFHDNGNISQTGYYTKDGQLQGNWFSYCQEGNKVVSAKYDKGVKVGKWFFWENNTLREVDYKDNVITNVNTWTNASNKITSN